MTGVIYDNFLAIVSRIEDLCSKHICFGKIYYYLFYKKMIAREAQLVDLKPGERVLHIGGGSFPFTAIHLALQGFKVQVVDMDRGAVKRARKVVEKWGLEDFIEIVAANGLEVSGAGFDAVWISLHVDPKEEIIKKLLSTLPASGRIIYRNPRGILRHYYPTVDPAELISDGAYNLNKQILQKESIIIYGQGEDYHESIIDGKSQCW